MPFPETNIGDGILLSMVCPRDADELFALVDKNREYLRQWMPWADATREIADIRAFADRSMKQDADGLGFHCAIRLDARIVGVLGHVGIETRDRKTELGYWIDRQHQGRGIVTRAVGTLLDHAFGDLDLHRVTIQAGEANLRSRAIAERLGFRLEGVLRESAWANDRYVNHVIYGMLSSEWQKRARA